MTNTRTVHGVVAFFAIILFHSLSFGKVVVPVFLFSGQSNMVGQGDKKDLSATGKETLENVMINVEGKGDQSKQGKWLPLGPGYGNTASNFGPELYFGKTLVDSLPNHYFMFIKYALNGVPLGSSDGFLPPSSNNGSGGKLYRNLIHHIENCMKSFHTAFDTSKYTPRWAGFAWLQGETDAKTSGLADKYESNLESLINDIRDALQVPDLPVIIPLITTASRWKESAKVRSAVIAVRERLENIDTLETKGFHLPDNMHYDAEGQKKIGILAALRWLAMDYQYDNTVPIVRRHFRFFALHSKPTTPTESPIILDLLGRKLNIQNCCLGRFRDLYPIKHVITFRD